MNPELAALVEKVREAHAKGFREWKPGGAIGPLDAATLAAIRCIAEATREASEGMLWQGAGAIVTWQAEGDHSAEHAASVAYRAMHAASVLGEALRDGQ
jgi:hypothetical protein